MSAANGGVDQCVNQVECIFNLTPEAFYVDGLICYHLCCQVLQLNLTTRMVANQTINIKRFWRQAEMRNLTYD